MPSELFCPDERFRLSLLLLRLRLFLRLCPALNNATGSVGADLSLLGSAWTADRAVP